MADGVPSRVTMLFSSTNLPYWIFLGAGVALFGLVILSGGGDDDLDADIDADVDADVDAGLDTDIDADTGGSGGVPLDVDQEGDGFSPLQVLAWIGLGRTPLILLLAMDLTLWGFLGWGLTVAVGEALATAPGRWFAVGVFLGSLAFALFVGSVLSRPIGRVFASFSEDASGDRLVGCAGAVTSAFVPLEDSGKIGQVDVKDASGNLVTISAKLPTWAQITLRRGAKVLVIDHQSGYYLVIAQGSIDQAHWLNSSRPS